MLLQWGVVAVSFLFFYYAAFGCTWGMVPWVYQAEINSLSMRTVGAAAATATNWVGIMIIVNSFLTYAYYHLAFRVYMYPVYSDRNCQYRLPVLYQ